MSQDVPTRDMGVIFDMDGVLVQSYRPHYESWRIAAARYGVSITEADFAATFGRTSRQIIRDLWPGRFTDEQVAAFDAAKEEAYRQILREHFPEMPGASDLIDALHAAGLRLAIGSSGPRENVELVRSQLRSGHRFNAIVHGMDVERGKPEPDVFLKAAEKLNLPPARCAVIEDAVVGLEAARRAGMIAIALTGTADRDALARKAHLVVDALSELTPVRISGYIERSSG